uniref:Uncharacterized protein n=1 Tax=Lepeophtheirus salmonis TaxID=72036 RepID=A0A0K2U281_LEPSM
MHHFLGLTLKTYFLKILTIWKHTYTLIYKIGQDG